MIYLDQFLFNLLINGALSFLAGLMMVMFALTIFRVETSRWKILLLTLPFIKIIWDISRGIPDTSSLYYGVDPILLPPYHRYLSVGAAISHFGPVPYLSLKLIGWAGELYSISLADIFGSWLEHIFGGWVIWTSLTIMLTGSVYFVTKRIFCWIWFEVKRRREFRVGGAQIYQVYPLGFRIIKIYVSSEFSGSPFTGGLLRPYICLPRDAIDILDSKEISAVIAHEVAHVRGFDWVCTFAIKLLGDFFWFVPGYRWLSRKIERMREILADRSAVIQGATPEYLANALLKLKELQLRPVLGSAYSAFFKERALLSVRVRALMGEPCDPRPSRLGWSRWYVKFPVMIWVFGSVMIATLGGNYAVADNQASLGQLIAWLAQSMGWV